VVEVHAERYSFIAEKELRKDTAGDNSVKCDRRGCRRGFVYIAQKGANLNRTLMQFSPITDLQAWHSKRTNSSDDSNLPPYIWSIEFINN
jgi:hypothetical protein